MKLISEGPPSYRGSASSWCSTIRSACRHHRPRQLRRATAGYREQLSEHDALGDLGAITPRVIAANQMVDVVHLVRPQVLNVLSDIEHSQRGGPRLLV